MPLARYQLKNELRLGDPELYRAADKDDPETLLEAVAMAGLAGLLRQLGDLSQFAAEIFHDLHEEVMVTTARGQGLMARVQQLEAEVPSLEKAFLSQTHHLSFFSKGGIGWHPNLQSEHNLISRGDVPRFVMDSYEECRGPPQLFLLDKFDVAGAGACLKRYTDPSFFKLESASSGLATVEVYREKKNHKIKKKGTRIRNGETPEIASTHTKLHQLLLEERIENACADPGRLVKLKNRQLNGFATEAKTGKSYMEKFLESPLQDDEVARETSISPPHVRLVSDDTSEEGIKILEISTVGPVKRSLENERTYSWTNEEEAMPKPSSKMPRETDGNLVKKHEQGSSRVSDEISINYSKVPESELEMDEQKERENYLYGYHSDDLTSKVDHHLDALATGEPELDIDYKYRDKNSFLHIQKLKDSDDKEHQQQDRFLHSQSFTNSLMSDGISSFKRDINEVHAELQARLSDSQSGTSFTSDDNSSLKRDRNEEYSKWKAQFSDFQYTGKSSTSDVNSSFDKDIPCFSCSDSLSTVGETIPSEPVSFKSNEYNGSEIEHTSSSQLTQIFETQKTDRGKFLMHDGTHDQEKVISGTGDVSSGSYLMNSGRKLLYSDLAATSMTKISKRAQSKETQTGLIEHQLRLADEGTKHHAGSMDAIPGAFSQMKVDADATVSSEKYRLNELADGDHSVSCNAILKISNHLKLASEDECSESSKIKGLQAESPNQNCSDILVCRETGTEEHPICSSTEVDLLSSSTALMLDVQASKAADGTEATQLNSQDESESWGVEAKCYDQQFQFEELSEMEHCDELSGSTCRVDADEDDSLLKGSSLGDYGGQDYHVTDDVASTELQPEDQSVSVDAAENDLNIASCLASSMVSSTSRNLSNLQEPMPGTCSHETKMESNEAEPIKIAVDLNAEKMENQQEPSSDSNVISSSMRSSTNFEESRFSFADPQEKQRDISEAVDRQSLTKLEKQRGVHQLNAAYANIELSLNRSVPCNNSEICNSIQGSSPKEQTEHSSVKDKILKFSKLDSREPKTKSLLQSKRLRNGKDGLASSSSNQLESGNHLEKFLRLQDGEGDAGFLPRCLENSSSKKPQSEQMQISNHLEKERNSYAASRSVPEIHLGQSSSFESLSLSASQEVNFTKHVMDKPHPPLPDPLSEAPKINSGEMPPMPPLPPMQWRTGKVQPASLASVSFQSIQPIKSKEQAQYSSPTSEREALQFQNPVLPVMAMEGDKLQNTSGFLVGGHPVAISMQLPIMLNEANGKNNYLVLERSQTHNPFQTLPVPVVPASKPAQGYIVASGREVVQNSNTSSPIAPVEHDISVQDPISPEELSQPPSQPILEVKTLQQPANNLEGKQGDPSISPMSPSGMENVQPNHNLLPSEGKQEDPSNSPVSPPGMENVQPNHNLLRSGSEMASTLDKSDLASDFKRERLNGKPNDKLPRPRSPAIDAVAALDKSKLRKVADRPPTVPKVEERDSFLEQIRTKSFNLRPTATTRKRYHYQGPRTNLKVAAILEKANAIRQALAGSDEDDDKDSWSDS